MRRSRRPVEDYTSERHLRKRCQWEYRGVNKGVHVLISRIQAGPGRTVQQEQEEISRNHVQTFSGCSVHSRPISLVGQ